MNAQGRVHPCARRWLASRGQGLTSGRRGGLDCQVDLDGQGGTELASSSGYPGRILAAQRRLTAATYCVPLSSIPAGQRGNGKVAGARDTVYGSDDHHRPMVSAGVPVACPTARSETACSGHSRTRQIASELQMLWWGKHDKPVPKLIVPPCQTRARTDGKLRSSAVTHGRTSRMTSDLHVPRSDLQMKRTPKP